MFELDRLQLRDLVRMLDEHYGALRQAYAAVAEAQWQPDMLGTEQHRVLIGLADRLNAEAAQCLRVRESLQWGLQLLHQVEELFLAPFSLDAEQHPEGAQLLLAQTLAVPTLWQAITSAGRLAQIAVQTALVMRLSELHREASFATGRMLIEHPWLLFFPGVLAAGHAVHTVGALWNQDWQAEQAEFWAMSFQNLEYLLGATEGNVEHQLLLATLALGFLGWQDRAELQQRSVLSAEQRQQRLAEYAAAVREEFGDGYAATLGNLAEPLQPVDLHQLLIGLGQIDYLGGSDEAVIRIAQRQQHPEQLIVMVPSTQEWLPGSQIPNDALGNLTGIQGNSALTRLVDEALVRHLQLQGIEPADAELLLVGFSQGGIVATAFATVFGTKYLVSQVVTVGSPIGKFTEVPGHTRVLALEANDDPVPKLDGRANPKQSNWQTHQRFQGEGSVAGAHNVLRYAEFAGELTATGALRDTEQLEQFFGNDYQFTDYFARRSEPERAG